ncbi:MAG TPA: hypothetical protein VNJ08_05700 [Bacteriovoracaceae bacterium]|nr:hypothetical protein [Bacteriovoracaceae bacterium]
MLTKHGFFHVLEASSAAELMDLMAKEKKSHFILIQGNLINEGMITVLLNKNDFIILAQPEDETALSLAARFGVKRFMSFPFSSQNLLDKIQQISQ